MCRKFSAHAHKMARDKKINAGKLKIKFWALRWAKAAARQKSPRKMVTVSSSSPYHQHSSPFSLSLLLEQHHCNQCVPSSPSLSPFLRQHGALAQKLLQPTTSSFRAGSSPAPALVPDLALQGETSSNTANSGSRAIYSGSPLLRQILRGKQTRNIFMIQRHEW